FSSDGDDELPLTAYVTLLTDGFASKTYNESAIPAMHLVTAVLASNWIQHANYFELIKMYSLLAVSAACYQSRWKKLKKRDNKFIEEIIINLDSHMAAFIRDVMRLHKRGPLINQDAFAEFAYYHPRKKMISGILAVAALNKKNTFDEATADFVWEFI